MSKRCSRLVGVRVGAEGSESCIVTSSGVVSFCGEIVGDWMATLFLVERDEEGVGILWVDGIGRGIVNVCSEWRCWCGSGGCVVIKCGTVCLRGGAVTGCWQGDGVG